MKTIVTQAKTQSSTLCPRRAATLCGAARGTRSRDRRESWWSCPVEACTARESLGHSTLLDTPLPAPPHRPATSGLVTRSITLPFTTRVVVHVEPPGPKPRNDTLKTPGAPFPPKSNPSPPILSISAKSSAKGSPPKKSSKMRLAIRMSQSVSRERWRSSLRPLTASRPPTSYVWRFWGSLRMSYACATALNRSSARSLSSGFLSGCHRRACLRYAFFSSSSDTPRLTPSTWYKLAAPQDMKKWCPSVCPP
mmetsp:Transcript_5356/g.12798  ORF Transcript_5356/g.12798 Transcript_5356/m.12798 type:complete len:251 (+) Transcript_5356:116-868(+)